MTHPNDSARAPTKSFNNAPEILSVGRLATPRRPHRAASRGVSHELDGLRLCHGLQFLKPAPDTPGIRAHISATE